MINYKSSTKKMNRDKSERFVNEWERLMKTVTENNNPEVEKKIQKLWKRYYRNKPFNDENWRKVRRWAKNLIKGYCEIDKCKNFVRISKSGFLEMEVCKKCKSCATHCFYKCQSKINIWKYKIGLWWDKQKNKFRKHQPEIIFGSLCGGKKKNKSFEECDKFLCSKANKELRDKVCQKHCGCVYPHQLIIKKFWNVIKNNWNIIVGFFVIIGTLIPLILLLINTSS